MCDYSLHQVASRPAKVADKLVTTEFSNSITRGFAAVGQPDVAVCLLPGTELAFDDNVKYERAIRLFGKVCGPQGRSLPAGRYEQSARPP